MKISRRAFGIGLTGLGLSVSDWNVAGASTKPIRIGVLNSMTGSLASYGQEGQPAFEYLIGRINAGGGIKSKGGAKIELVPADDASQPAKAAEEARRLIVQEGVQLLVGSIQSVQMIALAPVLAELKVPALSVWGGGSESDYIYSLGYPFDRGTAQNIHDLIMFLGKERGFPMKTAVMAYSDYEGGQRVNEFLVKRLKDSGIEIAAEVPLDPKASDHTAQMRKIAAIRPDTVAGLVTPRNGVMLQRARFEAEYKGSVFCSGLGYSDLSMWRELGPDIGKAVLANHVFGMTAFSPGAKITAMKNVAAELSAAGLSRVGQGAIQFAQAARIVQRILEHARDLDTPALLSSFKSLDIPRGDPDLYLAKPKGLRFASDRLLEDGSAMFVRWTAEQTQQVVFPKEFAEILPTPPT